MLVHQGFQRVDDPLFFTGGSPDLIKVHSHLHFDGVFLHKLRHHPITEVGLHQDTGDLMGLATGEDVTEGVIGVAFLVGPHLTDVDQSIELGEVNSYGFICTPTGGVYCTYGL